MHYLSSRIKNLLLAFCVSATAFSAQAQWVSIPDTNFGKWLNTNGFNMCLQGNSTVGWEMDTTCNEVVSATVVDCDSASISSIEGIQYFDNLNQLYCRKNNIALLPVLPNSLKALLCSHNKLTTLMTLPDSLKALDCANNQLTTLPTLPNTMISLYCWGNKLHTLPSLPNSITVLSCYSNKLTALPALPDSLYSFICL